MRGGTRGDAGKGVVDDADISLGGVYDGGGGGGGGGVLLRVDFLD